MSLAQTRGGIPRVFRDTITITGRKHRAPFYTQFVKARNEGAFPIRLYFTEADFDADSGYVTVPVSAAATPYGQWEGPVENDNFWMRGVGGSASIELTLFQRRG